MLAKTLAVVVAGVAVALLLETVFGVDVGLIPAVAAGATQIGHWMLFLT